MLFNRGGGVCPDKYGHILFWIRPCVQLHRNALRHMSRIRIGDGLDVQRSMPPSPFSDSSRLIGVPFGANENSTGYVLLGSNGQIAKEILRLPTPIHLLNTRRNLLPTEIQQLPTFNHRLLLQKAGLHSLAELSQWR